MTEKEKVYQFVPPEGLRLRDLSKRQGFKTPTKYLMSLIIKDMDECGMPHNFVVMGGKIKPKPKSDPIELELE